MSETPRFAMMANPMPTPSRPTVIAEVVARARRAEAEGFDIVSVADWAVSDPFPMLAVLARETERTALMTRVVANPTRSPVLLASATAWIDALSGGRFTLGLGASIPGIVTGRHGLPFDRPASRMEDSLTIIRALLGDPPPGVTRNPDGSFRYQGKVIRVERAAIDLAPIRRSPIVIAAAGPRMLQLAGRLADGIILELTTPGFVRWCLEHVRAGAAAAGRTLDQFEVITQPSILLDPTTPERRLRWENALNFYINHCIYPEFERLWEASGLLSEALAIRAAATAGDRTRAERLLIETIYPHLAVTGSGRHAVTAFWRWLEEHCAAGVTTVGLPLEIGELLGVSLAEVKHRFTAA